MLNNPPPLSVGLGPDPFMHGEMGRRLRLVADDDSLDDSPAVRLLEQLGNRPSARLYATRRAAPGRLTLRPVVEQQDFVPAVIEDPDGGTETAIPAASRIRAHSVDLAREHGVDAREAERLLRLATLARTSRLIDGAVVGAAVLSGPPFNRLLLPHCLTPSEAIALVGLDLRAHGDFAIWRDGSTTRVVGAERFYRAVAFAHVDELDMWIAAAASRWLDGSGHRALALVDGLATRLSRAFRARDFLQVRLRALDFKAVWDEVLFFFDVVLVQVMGAFDLLARLMHDLYELPRRSRPSWRQRDSTGWVSALAQAAPPIGALARADEALADVVDLVAELRNVIHDAPLSDELHDRDDVPGISVWGPGLIALGPDDAAGRMVAAAERRGGLVAWGMSDRSSDGAVVLDPGLFGEQTLRASTASFAQVLGLAERERLAAVPADDVSRWVPEQRDRESALALFGLLGGGLRQERATFA